jgi:hypothetical protein
MRYSNSVTLEFSDPCSNRVSSVAQKSIDPYPNDSCGRVCFWRRVLLLPGRRTVAVHGDAANELVVKKLRIEANGDETQDHERQDDKAQAFDPGGENRSQT